MDSYWPGSSLQSLIETIVQNYESDWERHYSEDEKTVRLREFIDAVAQSVVGSSEHLVVRLADDLAPWTWEHAQQIISALDLEAEVKARVEIHVAWMFATSSDAMAGRCLDLMAVALSAGPPERVGRFLRRMGRCYVAGFLPESVMLCRSVLESAIDELLVRREVPSGGKMTEKLKALQSAELLHADGVRDALTVWHRGNAAIHKDPDSVKQVLGTITITLRLLGELQFERPAS